MATDLTEQLDSRFFQIVRGNAAESYKSVPELLDSNRGLTSDELFHGSNVDTLHYLFNVSALAVSSTANSGVIHPVVMVPSVGSQTVFEFLTDRLAHYSKIERGVKFVPVDCNLLVGRSKLESKGHAPIEIPSLINWRMQHEDECAGAKIFILHDAAAITSSGTLTLQNVLSELSSISEEASFIVFFTPSSYYFVRATLTEEEFSNRFARVKSFDGFSNSDISGVKHSIENRLKKAGFNSKIKINDLVYELALHSSRGIPYYAFKIVQEALKSAIIDSSEEVTETKALSAKNMLGLDKIWQSADALTPGQIDILAALMTFKDRRASVYQIQDVLRQFRKVGDRSATFQQIRRMYEYELLDRDHPSGSKQVFYKVRSIALPAVEFRIKQTFEAVKKSD